MLKLITTYFLRRGQSTDGAEAFRAHFSRIGDLRALFPEAPILCLTATATKLSIEQLKTVLLMGSPMVHQESPDRQNIRLCVSNVADGVSSMDWLIELLDSSGSGCPKTIVYCRRIQDCSELYYHFMEVLGVDTDILHERTFDMIHSKTPDKVKCEVVKELLNKDSNLRVVFATKVLGMGLDFNYVQLVVHYGPPDT